MATKEISSFSVIEGAYKHIAACAIPSGSGWKCVVTGNPFDGSATFETILKARNNRAEGAITIETESGKSFTVPKYWMVPILLNDNRNGLQN